MCKQKYSVSTLTFKNINLWRTHGLRWDNHYTHNIKKWSGVQVDCVWNVMAHAQKPDFVFRRNGRVHLNRRGASVQSTTDSRGVRISGSNAGYTMFRGTVKSTGYPLHSPASPSLPLPCVTVCHHVSTGLYSLDRTLCRPQSSMDWHPSVKEFGQCSLYSPPRRSSATAWTLSPSLDAMHWYIPWSSRCTDGTVRRAPPCCDPSSALMTRCPSFSQIICRRQFQQC